MSVISDKSSVVFDCACAYALSQTEIYKQEQVEKARKAAERRGRERTSKAAMGGIVCVTRRVEEQKASLLAREEIACFFASIGWLLPFLGRLSTNRLGGEKRKKSERARANNDEVQREKKMMTRGKKSANQIIERIPYFVFISCCCHIDSDG